jgi:xylulose-5-phosphate/fructose-6-phosphate phosphoketolase
VEGTCRAHQVPLAEVRTNPEHLAQLEAWMRSYHPEELFDADGAPVPEITALAPHGLRRMSATPHANGGLLLRELRLPGFRDYAVPVPAPGAGMSEATRVLGDFLRDVIKDNPGYPGVTGIREILATWVGPCRVWIVARVDIDHGLSGAQVESLVRGIESGMKQLEYIYRVDVVPIGGAQAVDT